MRSAKITAFSNFEQVVLGKNKEKNLKKIHLIEKTKLHLKVKRLKTLFSTTWFNDKYQETFKMSRFETKKRIDNLLDAHTKSYDFSRVRLLEEINNELEVFSCQESTDKETKDMVFDFLRGLSDSVQEKFNKLSADDNNKK